MPPRLGVAIHVGHFTGEALVEPGAQAIEAISRRRGGDAGEFEAEGVRSLFDVRREGKHGLHDTMPAPQSGEALVAWRGAG